MDDLGRIIDAVDSHTEGEPTRIVTGGIGPIPGAAMQDKRAWLAQHEDGVRRALVLEPRGHAAIVLAYLTEPVTPDACFGVVFADDAGYLGMCGHGTIGVATVLVRLRKVAVREPVTDVVLDTPVGQVRARVRVERGRPRSVAFENVPSFVQAEDVRVAVPGVGRVAVDIAYGGNWFAFAHHAQLGLPVAPARCDELMAAAHRIRDALAAQGIAGEHPVTGARERITHVVIWADEGDAAQPATRALTLCPGRAYDRSPCGTGTSARVALLHRQGRLADGQRFLSRSFLGTEFRARVVGRTTVGPRDAVIPEIEGTAFVTGLQKFVLDPEDPLAHGLA